MVKKTENLNGGHRNRLRRRFLDEAEHNFMEHQYLELLLFYSIPRIDTNPMAHRLINRFGSFRELLLMPPDMLVKLCGASEKTAVLISLIRAISARVDAEIMTQPVRLTNPVLTGEYAAAFLDGGDADKLYLLCIDSAMRLLATDCLGSGGAADIPMYARKVTEAALRCGGSRAVLVQVRAGHSPAMSQEDSSVIDSVRDALLSNAIILMDYVTIGKGQYLSYAERNLMRLEYE